MCGLTVGDVLGSSHLGHVDVRDRAKVGRAAMTMGRPRAPIFCKVWESEELWILDAIKARIIT